MNSVLKTSSFDISSGNSHTWCRGKRNIQRTDQETNQALREAGKELQQAHGDHRKGGWLLIAPPPSPTHLWWKDLIIYLFLINQCIHSIFMFVCQISLWYLVWNQKPPVIIKMNFGSFCPQRPSFQCSYEEFHLRKKCLRRWLMC